MEENRTESNQTNTNYRNNSWANEKKNTHTHDADKEAGKKTLKLINWLQFV